MSNPAVSITEASSTHVAGHTTLRKESIESVPSEAASIPSNIVDPSRAIKTPAPQPRLPPLPDLRFEQSYLSSLEGAESLRQVAWITFRDQVFLPLTQGTLWTLALAGWRYWNHGAELSGNTLGSQIRRWWYGINNSESLPIKDAMKNRRLARKA